MDPAYGDRRKMAGSAVSAGAVIGTINVFGKRHMTSISAACPGRDEGGASSASPSAVSTAPGRGNRARRTVWRGWDGVVLHVHGDHEADPACPRGDLLLQRHQVEARLGPVPIDGRARLPIARVGADAPAAGDNAGRECRPWQARLRSVSGSGRLPPCPAAPIPPSITASLSRRWGCP